MNLAATFSDLCESLFPRTEFEEDVREGTVGVNTELVGGVAAMVGRAQAVSIGAHI